MKSQYSILIQWSPEDECYQPWSVITFWRMEEYSSPCFILGDEHKNVMYWHPNAIENVKEDWAKGVLQVVEEVEKQIAVAQKAWEERKF